MGIAEDFGYKTPRRPQGFNSHKWANKMRKRFMDWTNTEAGRAYSEYMDRGVIEREEMARGERKVMSGDAS